MDAGLLGPGSRGDLIPLSPSFLISHWEALDRKLSSQVLMGHDTGPEGAPQRDAQVSVLRSLEESLLGGEGLHGCD